MTIDIRSGLVECWEFKPTWWQKIKLGFAPVTVAVDMSNTDEWIKVTAKMIDGNIIITALEKI